MNKGLTFKDAFKETGMRGLLIKFYRDELKEAINKLPIKSSVKQKLKEVWGRAVFHLIRMLDNRSKAERNFALAYIAFSEDISRKIDADDKINSVLNGESPDTCMLWTFAPYLYKSLKEYDIEDKDAIALILNWSKDGNVHKNGIHLKGLEEFNKHGYGPHPAYILGNNPEGASHKFTEQKSRQIVKTYFLPLLKDGKYNV